jgi:uncharacterized protein (TIGR02300 family)
VTKPDLGTKRVCASCNARFYDLNKTPAICPACATVLVIPEPSATPQRPRRVVPTSISVVAPTPDATEEPVDVDADDSIPLLDDADEDDGAGGAVEVEGDEDDEQG